MACFSAPLGQARCQRLEALLGAAAGPARAHVPPGGDTQADSVCPRRTPSKLTAPGRGLRCPARGAA